MPHPYEIPSCFDVISAMLGNLLVKSYQANNYGGGFILQPPSLLHCPETAFKASSLVPSPCWNNRR